MTNVSPKLIEEFRILPSSKSSFHVGKEYKKEKKRTPASVCIIKVVVYSSLDFFHRNSYKSSIV